MTSPDPTPDPADDEARAARVAADAHGAQQAGADSSVTSPDPDGEEASGPDDRGVTTDRRALVGNDDAVAATTPVGTAEDSPTGTTPTGPADPDTEPDGGPSRGH